MGIGCSNSIKQFIECWLFMDFGKMASYLFFFLGIF